jgi:mRNA interferase RelE/StbE
MKAVAYTKRARKQWRKLPVFAQEQIDAALELYAETGEGNVKRLVNIDALRLRTGDYRAIFTETKTEIEVLAVGHRKDIYE